MMRGTIIIKFTSVILILQILLKASNGANYMLSKPSESLLTEDINKEEEELPESANSHGQEDGNEQETSIVLDELAEETSKVSKKWPSSANVNSNDHDNKQKSETSSERRRHKNIDDYANDDNDDDDHHPWQEPNKRLFAVELLKMLHEQYGKTSSSSSTTLDVAKDEMISNKEDRHQPQISKRQSMMRQLLEAISADGDIRRLKDWVQNSFNLASIGELTTQFVVSKLGSVNCAALFKPDPEENLMPRFLLFNEHYVDVPYELTITPTSNECLVQGRFDPFRKTVVLIHGFLTGYTLVDGMTNIKNRLLDINKIVNEKALVAFTEASQSNGSYLLTGDLELKLRRQKYNVIIVDWFSGANPVPRANYIQAAANARVVGDIIARFLITLASQCRTPSTNIQIIAHSLGCHVAGFTGKTMGAAGHKLGKITHLDPIGLCFGRLFSNPRFRLNPNDAIDTQAVHVSLNLFDNPLDGARSNFLVNGGRDQSGCQGTSELQNSTTSSVSLLFDANAKFSPCSHLRALSLFEDDLSSMPRQCQVVGYRCATYERFLAGKCGKCDAANNQCRLMGFSPIFNEFNGINLGSSAAKYIINAPWQQQQQQASTGANIPQQSSGYTISAATQTNNNNNTNGNAKYSNTFQEPNGLLKLVKTHSNGSIAWVIDDQELNVKIGNAIAMMRPKLIQATSGGSGQEDGEKLSATRKNPRYTIISSNNNNIANDIGGASRRTDRRLIGEHRELIAQTLDKIRADTRNVLTGGWTSIINVEPKYKVSSIFNSLAGPSVNLLTGLMVPRPSIELDHVNLPTISTASGETMAATDQGDETQDLSSFPAPIGSQPLPAGSSIGPLYFVGTSALSPYCVNYYQFRMLIAESRIKKLMQTNRFAPNRMAHISSHGHPQYSQQQQQDFKTNHGEHLQEHEQLEKPARQATLSRDMLHLTIKLSDSFGHFFKGFTMIEDVRQLARAPASELMGTRGPTSSETMVELTMLLNTTNPEPVRISETVISYYFHKIVLADIVEINYMSNISPNVRAKFSSILCPVAINDQHQLVRYIECHKVVS